MTFTKLFSSITASTVWCKDPHTKVVWVTMLAMADKKGRVWASIPGLAKEAGITLERTEAAINEFMSPDEYSRTKEHEGRRIKEIDGGWLLLNHGKYRALRDEEERRAYKTAKQREYRSVDNVDKSGPSCTPVDASGHNAEAEADTEKKKIGRQATAFDQFWEVNPKKRKKKPAREIWRSKRLDGKAEDLVADVQSRMVNDERWKGGFVPDPTTYLNQERWEDELDDSVKEASVDQRAKEYGLVRGAGESDESLSRRLGIAMTNKQYAK